MEHEQEQAVRTTAALANPRFRIHALLIVTPLYFFKLIHLQPGFSQLFLVTATSIIAIWAKHVATCAPAFESGPGRAEGNNTLIA